MSDLIRIVKTLRSPEGCPWDQVQTHESIRFNMIEETYEAVDAIDTKDDTALKEELGDVLLQVVFHSILAEEEEAFDFSEVIQNLCEKLIYRHPHVFSDEDATNPEAALDRWEEAKQKEKHQETILSTLEAVPKAFPALMRAQKVGKRAAKGVAAREDVLEYLAMLEETCLYLQKSITTQQENAPQILGEMFFLTCNIARLLHVESESCLQDTTDAFIAEVKIEENEVEEKQNEELCNKLALYRKMKSGGM